MAKQNLTQTFKITKANKKAFVPWAGNMARREEFQQDYYEECVVKFRLADPTFAARPRRPGRISAWVRGRLRPSTLMR
jgi:hypothetical protein